MAAHDLMLTFSDASGKTVQQEIADCDDTGGNYATFKSVGDDTFFKLRQDAFLTDAKVTATGGTVTRYKIYINGKDVGMELFNAGLGTGVTDRISNPIGPIRQDSEIRIEQLA